MIYCDTSFVAPLVIPEAASDAVEACIQRLPPGELAVSQWVCVEFASLLARRVRLKEFTSRQAKDVHREFDQMLEESLEVIVPQAEDFNLAAMLLRNYRSGLRAGDALHLAIARNQNVTRFLTLDRALVRAAARFRIQADSGIEP